MQSWSAFAQETPPAVAAPNADPTPSPAAELSADGASKPPAETTPPSGTAARGPVFVSVSITGYAVQAGDVASAIARELDVALSSVPEAARSTFDVVAVKGADLSITFRDHTGVELKRVVKAPSNDAQVSEVAALLAVNLSQDKSDELLAQLAPVTAPAAAAPSLSPVSTPTEVVNHSAKPLAPALPFVLANATIAHPLTIVRDVDQRTVGLEFGLFYSRVGAVEGVAVNALVLQVHRATEGVSLAGLGTIAGSDEYTTPQEGVRIAGLFNYGRGPFEGIGIAGLVDFEHVDVDPAYGVEGAQISGLVSGVDANVEGAQLAGLGNYSHALDGVQVGGLLNVGRGKADGAQVSGALNYAHAVTGAQLSGLANVAALDVDGAQIAGGVNYAADVQGAQIGLVNIGKHVKGAQIGIVNVADEVDGASVGVVTYSKKGQTQLTTWFDSTRPVNIGARFVSGALYAMPMVGGDPTKTEEFSFGLSLGARVPIDRFYFDLEGNSTNQYKDGSVDESAVDLRYRAAVGFRVAPWLGVFAGGGVRHQFHAKDGGEHRVRGLWNVGVDIF